MFFSACGEGTQGHLKPGVEFHSANLLRKWHICQIVIGIILLHIEEFCV